MTEPTSPTTSIIIHGHFYQPPRENPWLEEVETEPTAAPFHDWNARIEQECYRAVAAARVLGAEGRILEILNTLSAISFNFGPTLLTWMEANAPDTYAAILEADRESVRQLGHGNAIAHPYHHVILPLSTRRDKTTEVRWGIADFKRRFGRDPEGMWLPETAVDAETLDVLADEGIAFTILAPHQAHPLPPRGLPGRYRTSSGKTIALFFYDGDLAHGVAFGELIRDGALWEAKLLESASRNPGGVVSIATDGETFGHHHKFGEMALAKVIHDFRARSAAPGTPVTIENYASFLAGHPPVDDVALNAPSSWSCVHGIERWRSECGCKIAPEKPTQQKWRGVLRDAFDWLAGEIHAIYEREATPLVDQIWAQRDRYDPATRGTNQGANQRVRELLELERHALLLYTSCAWFFDDLAGIEPIQNLKYAARAIELTGKEAARLEAQLLDRLALARSNDPAEGSGRDIYLRRVKPRVPAETRLAGGFAMTVALEVPPEKSRAAAFESSIEKDDSGKSYLVTLKHRRTGGEHRFRVGLLGSEIEVALAGAALDRSLSWRLLEGDMWDRHRELLREARAHRLFAEVVGPEEQRLLNNGTLDRNEAIRRGAGRIIRSAAAGGEDNLTRAFRAIELLDQFGLAVPFDAQTAFGRAYGNADPDRRRTVSPLAWRLGFVPDAG
jgi:hypothetical protein